MKLKGLLAFIALGVIPSVIAFVLHPTFCKYGMNPICYTKCISPIIMAAPMLLYSKEDE